MWSIGDIGQRPEKSKKKPLKHEQMKNLIYILIINLLYKGVD